MIIRQINQDEIESANEIYEQARIFMRESGNPNQWNSTYPNTEDIKNGMKNQTSYVCVDGNEIVATFHFECDADDKTYHNIYNGEWKKDGPYAVIHRIAVKYHGQGIVDFCFNECFKLFPNIRIDTHRDNVPMQKVLERCGFRYCGIIYLESGDERLAFQKI